MRLPPNDPALLNWSCPELPPGFAAGRRCTTLKAIVIVLPSGLTAPNALVVARGSVCGRHRAGYLSYWERWWDRQRW